ncbi:MAG: alanine racemase, partial [Paludibacteraceae bacterium]|nr:alanine racemase [Paludibacteraceae bacterium]
VVTDNANFLVTDDPLKAMQKLAAYHRAKFHIPVLGVTGSNGKTIVKEWISQLIGDDKKVTRSPRSYNSQIGVPLSVLEIEEQTELAIIEAGISKPGEMDKLANIIKPTVGIFTHLGEAHQENFASLKEKCEQKLLLFTSADVLIYGKDDKLLDIAVAQADLKAEQFTWGKTAGTTVKLLSAGNSAKGYDIKYKYKDKEYALTLPFGDNASVENAMNCLCFMLWLGYDPDEVAKRFSTLKSVAMRLEVKNGENGCLVINDSYNSDFDSLSIALDFLNSQAEAKKLKKTIILSDIVQSGKATVALYVSVAELLKNKAVERLIGVGPEISANANLFNFTEKSFYTSTRELLESNVLTELRNEAVLLKGARSFRFEDVSAKISSIVHQTTLEVDITAILHNVDYFRSFLKPETKMVHMVKANAYGSGDVAVARALQGHGCDYLAVAVADEGATLRNEGISVPIIVMNPEIGGLAKIIDYHLEPEIYSFSMLHAFLEEAERQGVKKYPVHIKINTGMSRLGFELDEADEVIKQLKAKDALLVRSVFSHFVGSDEERFDDFTEEQVRRFTSVAD